MTTSISIGSTWDETARFCRTEAGLLLPVAALGFTLPLVLLLFAVPAEQAASGRLTPGPWMAWMIPCGICGMLGSLSISAMALRPGERVGDCLRVAFARLPAALLLGLLGIGFQVLLSLPAGIFAAIGHAVGAGALATLGNVLVLTAMLWLFVRVMPIWALLSDRPVGAWAAVRETFALTRGRYRPLLLVRVVGGIAAVLALLVTMVPLSAVCALVGVATGQAEAAVTLSYVLSGAAFAAVMTVWTVFVARLYRALGSSRGI